MKSVWTAPVAGLLALSFYGNVQADTYTGGPFLYPVRNSDRTDHIPPNKWTVPEYFKYIDDFTRKNFELGRNLRKVYCSYKLELMLNNELESIAIQGPKLYLGKDTEEFQAKIIFIDDNVSNLLHFFSLAKAIDVQTCFKAALDSRTAVLGKAVLEERVNPEVGRKLLGLLEGQQRRYAELTASLGVFPDSMTAANLPAAWLAFDEATTPLMVSADRMMVVANSLPAKK